MATTNSSTQVLGLFKTVFDKQGLSKNVPSFSILQSRIGLQSGDMPGDFYQVGVVTQAEHGTTYAASQSEAAAPTLNPAVAGQVVQAQVTGYQQITRSRLSYAAAAKAAAKGEKAFEQAYGYLLTAMKEAASKRLELSILYGQQGLGVVSSNTSGALLITDASWSSGTWAGMVGAVLEAWTATTVTATQHDGDLVITAVNRATKTITVSGSSTNVIGNDVLYFKGARTSTAWNEGPGFMKILSTTTGTLFNVSMALDTFQAQQYNVAGQLSFSAIIEAVMQAADYGLSSEVAVLVSNKNWAKLANNEAALRRYDSSYKRSQADRGVESLKFSSGTGTIEILPHPYMRESEAAVLAFDYCRLVGASKLTSGLPGIGDLAVQVTDTAAVELRMFADVAPFILKPPVCVYMYGITQ
jgi:hypothetical protein